MAHDLDGGHVAGENHDAALALADAGLHVLEAVADLVLVLGALLDAFVQLKWRAVPLKSTKIDKKT